MYYAYTPCLGPPRALFRRVFCRRVVFYVKKTRNSLPEFDLSRGPRRFSALRTHVLGII